MDKVYNVWYNHATKPRWTNAQGQDSKNPARLTWQQAKHLLQYVPGMEIRELNADNTPGPVQATDPNVPSVQVTGNAVSAEQGGRLWKGSYDQLTGSIDKSVVVNDHQCPKCKNTRVSKAEKAAGVPCWRCGDPL
jgi:hypothetical protein